MPIAFEMRLKFRRRMGRVQQLPAAPLDVIHDLRAVEAPMEGNRNASGLPGHDLLGLGDHPADQLLLILRPAFK
jgi:hypothetical protein